MSGFSTSAGNGQLRRFPAEATATEQAGEGPTRQHRPGFAQGGCDAYARLPSGISGLRGQHLPETGSNVHLYRYNAQMDCDTAIARKRVEGTVTDLVRAARLQKQGTQLFYPVSTNLYWQLITNRKARISELKQLSDKMIAMTRHSATDYLSTLVIDSVKPKYEVYRVQINDLNIRLRMLLNNEMDAAWMPEPYATQARMAKHVALADSRDKNLQLGVIAFRSKLKREPRRKDQIDRFVKAYDIAVDSINKNGVHHYVALLTKYYGIDAQTVSNLPKLKYSHAMEPRQRDLKVADINN